LYGEVIESYNTAKNRESSEKEKSEYMNISPLEDNLSIR
jgi:hypothetical protein